MAKTVGAWRAAAGRGRIAASTAVGNIGTPRETTTDVKPLLSLSAASDDKLLEISGGAVGDSLPPDLAMFRGARSTPPKRAIDWPRVKRYLEAPDRSNGR